MESGPLGSGTIFQEGGGEVDTQGADAAASKTKKERIVVRGALRTVRN
jgi:hypothetical protein